MKLIFIAGPFRGTTAWDVECNIRQAELLAFDVARIGSLVRPGCMFLCPHTNSRFFDGTLTGKFWLDGTMELLKRCDAAVFTKDWRRSEGAVTEHEYCVDHEIPTFHAEIPNWEIKLREWLKSS